MAKDKAAVSNSLLQELTQTTRYKRTQGKIARQLTLIAIWFVIGVSAWNLYEYLAEYDRPVQYGVSAAVFLAGFWFGFRVINWPVFADFLIAVEAEMNKVTWPSKAELQRSSIVVIVLVFAMAGTLYLYDILWQWLFDLIL